MLTWVAWPYFLISLGSGQLTSPSCNVNSDVAKPFMKDISFCHAFFGTASGPATAKGVVVGKLGPLAPTDSKDGKDTKAGVQDVHCYCQGVL